MHLCNVLNLLNDIYSAETHGRILCAFICWCFFITHVTVIAIFIFLLYNYIICYHNTSEMWYIINYFIVLFHHSRKW